MTDTPFKFTICVACSAVIDCKEPPAKCPECETRHTVRDIFTPKGPYSKEEFGVLVDRRNVMFLKQSKEEILNRLIATVAKGLADS